MYVGLRTGGGGYVTLDSSSLLVKAEAAQAQEELEEEEARRRERERIDGSSFSGSGGTDAQFDNTDGSTGNGEPHCGLVSVLLGHEQ